MPAANHVLLPQEDLHSSRETWNQRLAQERDAFDRQLDTLLESHKGEFVVFYEGRPLGFYASHTEAHRGALSTLGLDRTFLIARVEQEAPQPERLIKSSDVRL